MTIDPGRLASSLNAFGKDLSDSSLAMADTIKMSSHEKALGTEQVERAEKQSRITANQLVNDQELVKKTAQVLKTLDEHCRDELTQAQQTLQKAQAMLTLATSTLAHWEAELEKAQAWLARALARLDAARRALAQAQAELSRAQSALYYAQNALSSCQNNKERSNCSGEASAVRAAQARVYTAQQEVAAAEQEVRDAEAEVALARARVAACTHAVSFAREAMKVAQTTLATAQQGINRAERSIEHVAAAQKALEEVKIALQAEEDAVEGMKIVVRLARQSEVEATQHLKTAEYYEEAAQRTADGAGREIREKVHQLHMYNREDLGEVGSQLGTLAHQLMLNPVAMRAGMIAYDITAKVIPFLSAAAMAAGIATAGASATIETVDHFRPPATAQEVQAHHDVVEGLNKVFDESVHIIEYSEMIEHSLGE